MINFTFSNTTKIVFGRGVEEQAGKEAAKWGKKVMLHYGGGHIVRSCLKDRVVKSLQEAGLEIVEFGGAQPNPRLSLVREGIELARREKVDLILAVGGEPPLTGKAIGIYVPYDGDVWDFFAGKADAKESLP